MPAQLDNKVAAMFAAANDAYETAEVRSGPTLPPVGNYNLAVIGVESREDTFRIFSTKDEVPCVLVRLEYEVIPDSTSPDYDPNADAVRFFDPQPFRLVPNPKTLPADNDDEKPQRRASIDWERYKTTMSILLGDEFTGNPLADSEKLLEIINGDAVLMVSARLAQRRGSQYHNLYINENLTTAS